MELCETYDCILYGTDKSPIIGNQLDTNKQQDFNLAVRSTYIRVDLDAILENVEVLKRNCADHTGEQSVYKIVF